MFRRVFGAVFLAGACCGIAAADDFHVLIKKVEDGKITFRRREKPKEGEKRAPFSKLEETLPAAPGIKVFKGKEVKKRGEYITLDAGDELPGGLTNEHLKTDIVKSRGLFARIITEDGNKKIKEARILFPRSGPNGTPRKRP